MTSPPSRFARVFPIVVLWLGSISYAAFAVQWLAQPESMARGLGITLLNGDATSDARAVYGGLELGLGVFLAYSAWSSSRRTQGLAALTLTLAGLGLSRLAGILLAPQGVSHATWQLLATDFGGTTLAAIAWWLRRSTSRAPQGGS